MTTSTRATDEDSEPEAWKGQAGDPQDVRLRAALLSARRRLNALEHQRGANNRIFKACKECWERANREAVSAKYLAWDCLHQFDEEMLGAMSKEEREARWGTLRAEAEGKLKGSWRGKAAENIINLAPKEGNVPLHLVRELQSHVVSAAQNQQHKLELFQKQSLPWLTALLALAVAVALALALVVLNLDKVVAVVPWFQALTPAGKTSEQLAHALLLGIPAGALGGILSLAFSLGRADLKAKIPDMRLSTLVTLTRPLLGATVAIPVVVLLESGSVKVAGLEGSVGTFAFCFLGGFSERWFLGVMEKLETSKK